MPTSIITRTLTFKNKLQRLRTILKGDNLVFKMAEKRQIMNKMIPIVMDMLDIELDDVIFSDILADDQINDVISAVVSQHGLHNVGNERDKPIKTEDLDEELLVEIQNAALLASGRSNCWSVVPSHNFKQLYGMSIPVFKDLLQLITQCTKHTPLIVSTGRRTPPLPNEKQLLITLKYLSSKTSVEELALTYNTSEQIVSVTISHIINLLYTMMHQFINWPKTGEANTLQGLSKCIGVIDICRINIQKPDVHNSFYLDKTGKFSVALQAVCDYKMNFIHCCTGWPGSISDASVLVDSDLFVDVQNEPGKYFPEDSYLIGDSDFPLLDWLLTPYSNTEMTDVQTKFNLIHSETHALANEAFQRLKLRFPRLNYIDSVGMEDIVKTVLVCCALHNFCQNRGDVIKSSLFEQPSSSVHVLLSDENNVKIDPDSSLNSQQTAPISVTSLLKRDRVAEETTSSTCILKQEIS